MRNPFRSQNAWAKTAAISAAVLLVSLGLCGLNLAAFSHYQLGVSGPHVPGHDFEENLSNPLIPLGMLEILATAISALSLVVSLLGILISSFLRRTA